MAPATKPTKSTKPIKPYRRGETLGKASRAGKLSKPAPNPTKQNLEKVAAARTNETETEDDVEMEDDQDEEEEEEDGIAAAPVPVPVVKRKKGKKFIETKNDMMALINMITTEKETQTKAKLTKAKPPPKVSEIERKVGKAKAKQELMTAAKAVISAQNRAKKDRRTDRETALAAKEIRTKDSDEASSEAPQAKKRVSFA